MKRRFGLKKSTQLTSTLDQKFQEYEDGENSYSSSRVEEALELQVKDLRNRADLNNIRVPLPPRKKRWNTCIARIQDLGRASGQQARHGWRWGLSRNFNTAKNDAVRMANRNIQAIDTHHAQWRCIDSNGQIRRPISRR